MILKSIEPSLVGGESSTPSTVIICGVFQLEGVKVTELLRFPNALHAFAWFPWILYGINSVSQSDELYEVDLSTKNPLHNKSRIQQYELTI